MQIRTRNDVYFSLFLWIKKPPYILIINIILSASMFFVWIKQKWWLTWRLLLLKAMRRFQKQSFWIRRLSKDQLERLLSMFLSNQQKEWVLYFLHYAEFSRQEPYLSLLQEDNMQKSQEERFPSILPAVLSDKEKHKNFYIKSRLLTIQWNL